MMARSLNARARLARALVTRGFATPSEGDVEALVAALRRYLKGATVQEAPECALCKVAQWDVNSNFSVMWAALLEAIRWQLCPPAWLEDASVRFATLRWFHMHPVTTGVERPWVVACGLVVLFFVDVMLLVLSGLLWWACTTLPSCLSGFGIIFGDSVFRLVGASLNPCAGLMSGTSPRA